MASAPATDGCSFQITTLRPIAASATHAAPAATRFVSVKVIVPSPLSTTASGVPRSPPKARTYRLKAITPLEAVGGEAG